MEAFSLSAGLVVVGVVLIIFLLKKTIDFSLLVVLLAGNTFLVVRGLMLQQEGWITMTALSIVVLVTSLIKVVPFKRLLRIVAFILMLIALYFTFN